MIMLALVGLQGLQLGALAAASPRPEAGVMISGACVRALAAACGDVRLQLNINASGTMTSLTCDVCSGTHAAALRSAGCSAGDVQAWCTGVGGGGGGGGAEWMLWPRDVNDFLVAPNTSAVFAWNVTGGSGATATFNFTIMTYTGCTPKCIKGGPNFSCQIKDDCAGWALPNVQDGKNSGGRWHFTSKSHLPAVPDSHRCNFNQPNTTKNND